uniref:Membrane protein n=1 Tax=Magnetospirillum gryphiswaldense TaxID=55518 RepID=A4TU70_9PROT|nr:membrane protein [Magnetospirillum gryphiswaldense MSR-1]
MASTTPTATASDVESICWTCKPLEKYVELTQSFTDDLSSTLHEPMLMLFASLAALWVVVSAIKLPLRLTDKWKIIQDFVFITITGLLLGSQANALISYVYSSALEIMGGSSAAVFSIAGDGQASTGKTGLVALAANGELAVVKVFQAATTIAQAGSLYDPQNYVYALVLVVPYFLLVVAYSAQVVVAIFRATMVGVFAPFLFMAFAFGWGRDMAKAGAKTLLASILVLFACTAALALTIYGVKGLPLEPTGLVGDEMAKFTSISNPDFLVILFLGWAGTALMAEGTAIANSIAQTALTNTAAGIMTAGAAASAVMMGKKAMPAAQMAGKAAGALGAGLDMVQAASANPQAAGQMLAEKFRSINQQNPIQNRFADKFNKPGGGA